MINIAIFNIVLTVEFGIDRRMISVIMWIGGRIWYLIIHIFPIFNYICWIIIIWKLFMKADSFDFYLENHIIFQYSLVYSNDQLIVIIIFR